MGLGVVTVDRMVLGGWGRPLLLRVRHRQGENCGEHTTIRAIEQCHKYMFARTVQRDLSGLSDCSGVGSFDGSPSSAADSEARAGKPSPLAPLSWLASSSLILPISVDRSCSA